MEFSCPQVGKLATRRIQGRIGALTLFGKTRSVLVGQVVILALVSTACGGGNGNDVDLESVTCEPTGTTLRVSAENTAFDTDCLAAPSSEAFAIVFDNRDTDDHNVAIYPNEGEPLFPGEIFAGVETKTYDVPAIEAGTYRFQCDVHPEMNGVFIAA